MAFLMLLHEKMRLKRQVNKLTLKQLKTGNRLDRMTKNIERIQKMYSSRQSQLEKQASIWTKQATCMFQNMMGVGASGQTFNPMSPMYSMSGGTLTAALQYASTWDGTNPYTKQPYSGLPSNCNELLVRYMQGGITKDPTDGKWHDQANGNAEVDASIVQILQSVSQYCNGMVSQSQAMATQMSNDYQNNLSIWLEAQKAQMELEQEEALAPLEEEQTDLELEKDSIETQLTYAKERLQAIEQACSEGIKDSAPKFGLG